MKASILLLSPPLAGLIVEREDYMTKIVVSEGSMESPAWEPPVISAVPGKYHTKTWVYDVEQVIWNGKVYKVGYIGKLPDLYTCVEGIKLFGLGPMYSIGS